jgi:hypothetical protein
VSLNRRDFSKSVGLFSGYLAFGGPKILANEKLIVTPEEYFEEADDKGQIRGTQKFDGGPRWLDVNDILHVSADGTLKCARCGSTTTIELFDGQEWRCT